MDRENIGAVDEMLRARGYRNLDLQTIDIARWTEHPLLGRKYDVILCSHVLEHLPDPAMFLKRISECLNPAGVFIGLVPLNERIMDPHHVQRLNQSKILGPLRALLLEYTSPGRTVKRGFINSAALQRTVDAHL